MVIEYTVEGSIHSIIDVVHKCPIIGPFVFICEGSISVLPNRITTTLLSELNIFLNLNPITVRGRLLIHDDLLGNDVYNQCVSRSHIKAPWLSDDLNSSVNREILFQSWVDYSSYLQRKQMKL